MVNEFPKTEQLILRESDDVIILSSLQLAKGQVDAQNQPGERPGKQYRFPDDLKPVDDVYANGKLYKGSGKLEGKVAWISGGDSGIGRATAILFALEGADMTIVFKDGEEKDAEDTRNYIRQKTNNTRTIHLVSADLRNESNWLTASQWEDTFALNIHSYFHITKAALPYMPRGGSIMNMASINAFVGRDDLLDYTSTKGAVVSFTRGLSNQVVGEKGIRVNAICPGPIWTPLVPSTFSKSNVEEFSSGGGVPMGRAGQPVEVATCCVFLASEDSSYISGNMIHPNGGVVIN
ncbi:NAD-P-binding protein [Lentinula edodes]|uniref:NAD-P-binding protein n=1 Tax=Lentinula edodes TaxID=5353 RepID=UPI001E8EB892|nr:NAD-P-binding protein [Lentinula edodes]KAH7873285.1 NAD-P-binding protein [Lentinula edodes]